MSDTKWNSATTIAFVKEYGKHRCLWDTEHKDYRNREIRDIAIKSIVDAMNIDDFDIAAAKRKIRIIRSTYWNEKNKIQKKSDTFYQSKIKWYAIANSFLQTTKTWKDNDININVQEFDNSESKDTSTNYDNDINQIKNIKTQIIEIPEEKPKLTINKQKQSRKRKSNNLLNTAAKVLIKDITDNKRKQQQQQEQQQEQQKQQHDYQYEDNEFDLFGKTVACQLKKLPLIDAIELQSEIQQMIVHKRLTHIQRQNQAMTVIPFNSSEIYNS